MGTFLDQDEQVDCHKCCNDHNYVKQILSRKDDAKVAYVLSNDFVFERVKAEHAGLLHIIQTLCTLMHCLLCQAYEEGH